MVQHRFQKHYLANAFRLTGFSPPFGNDGVVSLWRSCEPPVVHGDVMLLTQCSFIEEHDANVVCRASNYPTNNNTSRKFHLLESYFYTIPTFVAIEKYKLL